MAQYQVTFFKDLLSYCGTPVRCMQRRVEIRDAASPADAAVMRSANLSGCGAASMETLR